MTERRPRLSVIVPAYNGAALVERCLSAIRRSEPVEGGHEVILVDDGSTDGTAKVAGALADRVVRLDDGPSGPGRARNAGVQEAQGEIVAFVDVDVIVHPDALRRSVEALDGTEGMAAVFGAYDEEPEAPGLASVYRNLLHRYVHLRGAGPAHTFWAGLGAVRREAFLEVGGFDPARFPRPQIEDIDLGYRLRDADWSILLDPEIQGTHLKRWRLRDIVRTDVFDRGIPWMRLLLERGDAGVGGSLNVSWEEKAKTALAVLGPALILAGPLIGWGSAVVGAVVSLSVLVVWNLPFYGWLARRRGWPFALVAIPLHLLYHLLNTFSAVAGWTLHRFGRRSAGRDHPRYANAMAEVPLAGAAERREES